MFKRLILLALVISLFVAGGYAQEINFGQYGNYNLTVEELTMDDLDFGQIVSGSGEYRIDRNNGKVISITGVEYLDVIVEVNAQNYLYLDGSHSEEPQERIPFTLQAAYSNNKGNPIVGKAKPITNINKNYFTVQFPILERQSGPPGPPPPPPTDAFDQSKIEETANLYLYGSINVGEVDAGHYSSEITITINYD